MNRRSPDGFAPARKSRDFPAAAHSKRAGELPSGAPLTRPAATLSPQAGRGKEGGVSAHGEALATTRRPRPKRGEGWGEGVLWVNPSRLPAVLSLRQTPHPACATTLSRQAVRGKEGGVSAHGEAWQPLVALAPNWGEGWGEGVLWINPSLRPAAPSLRQTPHPAFGHPLPAGGARGRGRCLRLWRGAGDHSSTSPQPGSE